MNRTPNKQSSLSNESFSRNAEDPHGKNTALRKKYRILSILLIGVMIAAIILYFLLFQKCLLFGHKWVSANCTEAKTCSVCGQSEGVASGHDWADATCTAPKTCTICGATEGEVSGHEWADATCTAPQTCIICGVTEGDPLEHNWAEATCTTPVMCTLCGETSGEPLGHIWSRATFTAPKTCQRCGTTEGTAIPYQTISVENEIAHIKKKNDQIYEKYKANGYRRETVRSGVEACYDDAGNLTQIVVNRGTDGIGQYSSSYDRMYSFENGKLFFAYYFGADEQRLYFYDGLLMRWRHNGSGSDGLYSVAHDFEFSDEFYMWQKLALDEIASFPGLTQYQYPSGTAEVPPTQPYIFPSKDDVIPFGEVITYPNASSYLSSYEIKYVKAPKENSIYVFWSPDGSEAHRRKYLLYHGDEVMVLARQGGFSCVIFTSQSGEQQIGWANSGCLIW